MGQVVRVLLDPALQSLPTEQVVSAVEAQSLFLLIMPDPALRAMVHMVQGAQGQPRSITAVQAPRVMVHMVQAAQGQYQSTTAGPAFRAMVHMVLATQEQSRRAAVLVNLEVTVRRILQVATVAAEAIRVAELVSDLAPIPSGLVVVDLTPWRAEVLEADPAN